MYFSSNAFPVFRILFIQIANMISISGDKRAIARIANMLIINVAVAIKPAISSNIILVKKLFMPFKNTTLQGDIESILSRCRIKKSIQTRKLSARYSGGGSFTITAPKRVSERNILFFIQKNRSWFENKIALSVQEMKLPESLAINLFSKEYIILLKPSDYPHIRLSVNDEKSEITLSGLVSNEQACINSLRKWLMKQAKSFLPGMLDEVAKDCGIEYVDVKIKSQKSRWGSCSAKGNINLNARLLFVPYKVAKYVMIHEICHIKHLNHSSDFWKLVGKYDPEFKAHESQLKYAWSNSIPKWM